MWLYYGTGRWNGTPTSIFFVGVGGVSGIPRDLGCAWSTVLSAGLTCSDGGVLLRRGIELTLFYGVEGVFLALGGCERGRIALYIGVFGGFQPI